MAHTSDDSTPPMLQHAARAMPAIPFRVRTSHPKVLVTERLAPSVRTLRRGHVMLAELGTTAQISPPWPKTMGSPGRTSVHGTAGAHPGQEVQYLCSYARAECHLMPYCAHTSTRREVSLWSDQSVDDLSPNAQLGLHPWANCPLSRNSQIFLGFAEDHLVLACTACALWCMREVLGFMPCTELSYTEDHLVSQHIILNTTVHLVYVSPHIGTLGVRVHILYGLTLPRDFLHLRVPV